MFRSIVHVPPADLQLPPYHRCGGFPGASFGRLKLNRYNLEHTKLPPKKMSINLPLEPQKEARLLALAQSKGLSSADDLVREAIDKILADAPEALPRKTPTRSLRGLLAKYGPAPSAEEIDENRAEMFASFPRSDF
jgi:hypothetical protein